MKFAPESPTISYSLLRSFHSCQFALRCPNRAFTARQRWRLSVPFCQVPHSAVPAFGEHLRSLPPSQAAVTSSRTLHYHGRQYGSACGVGVFCAKSAEGWKQVADRATQGFKSLTSREDKGGDGHTETRSRYMQ